ncbi:TPA: hypothetical protein ACG05V_005476 [Bacillus pacificus]|uniref:hypothetical protein n=1 Tax=Bacillus pacificus TaxID=2026187 RepID=UPI00027CD701|nr:hypothetical protein [Bacillus pacificus]AFQ13317.1 Hypothetical protein BCK_27548 [Bacillus cereus FRI-35]MCU5070292.1 hypothetical protein [Bacillus pacificus]
MFPEKKQTSTPNVLKIKGLDSQYVVKEKIFEAINFSVYIVTGKHQQEEEILYELLLIKHFNSEEPSAHIWHKKIPKGATTAEIAKEVSEAIQSGFIKK